ncbi:MAG: right-handed parallel beta-helix repeat-containing protein [Pseudomonadota bacterium]|nr:right-handed parallel beta-helix repeat-containing protein [Pseudomonadota bacterium]
MFAKSAGQRIVSRMVRRNALPVATAVSLLFASGQALAKDLYVSLTGSDSVTYEANSASNPWRNIDRGIYALRAGDTLYIRGGNYSLSYPIWLRNDSTRAEKGGNPALTNTAQSGTAAAPVRVTAYPGEAVTIDASGVNLMHAMVTIDDKNYWTFENLSIINAAAAFCVALDGASDHITLRNLNIRMNRGGDNAGAIQVVNERGTNVRIESNTIVGPGHNVHLNTSGIWINRTWTVKILGNVISNAPVGIYFKHGLAPGYTASDVDVEVAYNYIRSTNRDGARFSVSHAHIHDNIFGADTTLVEIGPSPSLPNGDYNRFVHNTVLVPLGLSTEDTNQPRGAYLNVIRDNVLVGTLGLHRWGDTSLAHATTLDYNLYPLGKSIFEFGGSYSLTEWTARSGQDLHSKVGLVQFLGGALPLSIDQFRLLTGSLGLRSASDGKDIGADIDAILRAISGQLPAPPPAPVPPGQLSIR